MRKYGVNVIVAINKFGTDTDAEIDFIKNYCIENGADFELSEVFAKGADGGTALAEKLVDVLENKTSNFAPLYSDDLSVKDKILTIVKEIYGGSDVMYSAKAEKKIAALAGTEYEKMPVCMAKTQYSLSDDPALLGRPEGFTVTVRDIVVNAGAGFITALNGDIMTMPGLPKMPAAENIDIDDDGNISGLF